MAISRADNPDLELTRQLTRITSDIRDVMGAERATLYLWDEESRELRSRVILADGIGEIRLRLGEGIAGTVMQTGETVRIDDVALDPRFLGRFDRESGFVTRSMLCQPLANVEGQRIGVLQILNKRGGPFDERDVKLLEALDSQTAIAIENSQLVHALRASQAAEAALLAERERQASELSIARSIQMGLLPRELHRRPDYRAAALIEPAREVGGDLYDLFELDDDRIGLVVGDVSGKGVPAALFMAITRTLLRALAIQISRPSDLLAALNSRLEEENPSNMFVTLFYGIFDRRDGMLRYASAGHNSPFLARAGGETLVFPRVKGIALGVFEAAIYEEGRIALEPGDHLLLYTDGLTEAMNASNGLFGDERALAAFAERAELEPGELLRGLRQEVAAHVGGAEASDDLTLLALQIVSAIPESG